MVVIDDVLQLRAVLGLRHIVIIIRTQTLPGDLTGVQKLFKGKPHGDRDPVAGSAPFHVHLLLYYVDFRFAAGKALQPLEKLGTDHVVRRPVEAIIRRAVAVHETVVVTFQPEPGIHVVAVVALGEHPPVAADCGACDLVRTHRPGENEKVPVRRFLEGVLVDGKAYPSLPLDDDLSRFLVVRPGELVGPLVNGVHVANIRPDVYRSRHRHVAFRVFDGIQMHLHGAADNCLLVAAVIRPLPIQGNGALSLSEHPCGAFRDNQSLLTFTGAVAKYLSGSKKRVRADKKRQDDQMNILHADVLRNCYNFRLFYHYSGIQHQALMRSALSFCSSRPRLESGKRKSS